MHFYFCKPLANNCYHGLKHLFRSQFLNLSTKLNLYKTLFKPVPTYGSKCWSLNRRNEEQLQVFERRILRKIFGPICDNNVINNRELYSIYTDPDIIKTIKISKLCWTGNIMRMPEENPVKKLTLLRPEGSRRAGRPKLR
jgi:hypothetical protein